ncbi:2-dehydropantoate 2-reductase [Domibacillus indicus]|uniref:2-dehydropantoate 2-reductase n=1 Tax=Domibacillus indicus TaxID=1437523 RepID=UPI00204062C0|nr:2-dehydropantoate 2-reductase [Domibacillus indicus]MCM3787664.1 2-dehydropantoate 2-reductase [Domibacillus indicus]
MNIHIIGAGALGLFFAAEWSSRHRITIQTRTNVQRKRLEKEGIHVIEQGQSHIYPVQTAAAAPPETDLIVAAVKQYHLPGILQHLPKVSSLLFIQNGLSHLKLIQQLPFSNIYAGSVTHGAAKIDERTVQVNGRGQTKIACVKGGEEAIVRELETPVFSFQWAESAYEMLVDKMAANAVINPLTALLHAKNGELAENSEYAAAAENLCAEIAAVFPFKTKESVTQSVFDVCRQTAANESSMLRDIKAGRKTELDAIVGALLEEAAQRGVETPAFSLLYHLIKGKEAELGR